MKTVYDLHHWDHPDAAAEVSYGHATKQDAIAEAVRRGNASSDDERWAEIPREGDERGWLLNPDPVTGRQTEWGVFERQEAETDAERVQLALELLAADGQVEGSHHQAWVIDQTVRILAGDRYEAFIAEYCSEDEDGEPLYTWGEGIAP